LLAKPDLAGYTTHMNFKPLTFLVALVVGLGAVSCTREDEVEKPKLNADGTASLAGSSAPKIRDVSTDTTFMSFVGRLRSAVGKRDRAALANMMTESFGYSINPVQMGPGAFDYWDANNLWPELELVVKDRWQPLGQYMVSPLEFALDPEGFRASRAGCVLVGGSWKFAYFVRGE